MTTDILPPSNSPAYLEEERSPSHLRDLLDSVSDSLVVIGRNWVILYVNDSEINRNSAQALGLSSIQDFVGHDFWQIQPKYLGTIGETHLRTAMEHSEKRTWEIQSPNSGIWLRMFAYPSADGITLLCVDITERKSNETALRRSEESHSFLLHLSDALAPLTDAAVIERTATRMLKEHLRVSRVSFTKCNSETQTVQIYMEDVDTPAPSMLGCYPYENFPKYVSALSKGKTFIIADMETTTELSPEERKRFLALGVHAQVTVPLIKCGKLVACHAVRQHAPREWRSDEVDLVRESGERAWAAIDHVSAQQALRQSEARAQELARELEKRNQFVTDFFINISHEFKTPLTILLLGIDVLERKAAKLKAGAADILKSAAMMRQNAYRLSRLVNNLLDINKLDAGFMEPVWECCDIVQWLGNLVKSAEVYAEQRGLTLCFSCDVQEKMMVTDGFLVDRILLNLLSNAIKHTPTGGRIDVKCQISDTSVRIDVQDNGEGIPREKLGLIFERFRQVHSTMTRTSEGSGVGLALTKAIVELLEGTIVVQSSPGGGSTFTVELPLLDREIASNAPRPLGMQLKKRIDMEMSDIL